MLITKKRYKAEIIPMFIFSLELYSSSTKLLIYRLLLCFGRAGGGYGSFGTHALDDSQI